MSTAPLLHRIEATIAPQPTAATDESSVVGRVPFAGVVSAVRVILEGAITGHATNNRTLKLVNRKQDGTGTTVIASLTTTANIAAYDEVALTLSGTPADLAVAAGDTLEYLSDANASGVADPGGKVIVEINRS